MFFGVDLYSKYGFGSFDDERRSSINYYLLILFTKDLPAGNLSHGKLDFLSIILAGKC